VSFALTPDASIERMTTNPVSPAIDFGVDYQDLLFTPVPAGVTGARDSTTDVASRSRMPRSCASCRFRPSR
jgi:hypothetical protein